MTKTYAQISKQIAALQQDAERVRLKEVKGVIGRIRTAITAYNLSAADLGFANGAPKAAGKKAAPVVRRKMGNAKAKAPAEVKFRNDNGGTWGGRGKRPQWLRDAINSGKALSDFAVK